MSAWIECGDGLRFCRSWGWSVTGVGLLDLRFVDLPGWDSALDQLAACAGLCGGKIVAHVDTLKPYLSHALMDDLGSGSGDHPLSNVTTITLDGFIQAAAELDRAEARKDAERTGKQRLIRKRRSEFATSRAALQLALLDAGNRYVCAVPGCDADEHLHLDHKRALSRGGTDNVENLQFLCKRHNSIKGDRDLDLSTLAGIEF